MSKEWLLSAKLVPPVMKESDGRRAWNCWQAIAGAKNLRTAPLAEESEVR